MSEVAQLCPTFWDPMDCSLPGSSVHGIFQARILEWVAVSFSRRSSWPRDWTPVSWIVGRRFTVWATRKWQPTPVFLPGESNGWRSLVGYSPWRCKESDTPEWLHFHFLLLDIKGDLKSWIQENPEQKWAKSQCKVRYDQIQERKLEKKDKNYLIGKGQISWYPRRDRSDYKSHKRF